MSIHRFSGHPVYFLPLLALFFISQALFAHHGWRWATDEEHEITGTIAEVKLGNPHGEITLDVNGNIWIAEVGQPWRNERAGLTGELLSPGQEITIHGHRSATEGELVIKAERVIIDGKSYDLYPERDS